MLREDNNPAESNEYEFGTFYVMLLEPELDPNRFKLGYSISAEGRRRQFLTSAPFVRIERTWPCKSLWERTAIDFIAHGCERLSPEVFRADNIESIIERAVSFFSLSPPLENEDADSEFA